MEITTFLSSMKKKKEESILHQLISIDFVNYRSGDI